jgi:uroporphyrinogen decarboxylase
VPTPASRQDEAFQRFLAAARGGRPEGIPTALIVDSPWLPGYAGMSTYDFFLFPERWLAAHLGIAERFPDVVFLPGFWVEYGMANEPTAFGARPLWQADSPPPLRAVDLPVERWRELAPADPETDGLMPFVLRRMERLEQGELPQPHRIRFAAARGPLAVAGHVLGLTRFLETTAAAPEAARAALDVFSETAIAFLRAQLARLREPVGILLLDDVPGLLSPKGFDALALPCLQRVFDAFPGLVRVYHNDTPCEHLLSRIGQLHCEVWNMSHELDLGEVRAAVGPRMALMGNVAPLDLLVRGTPEQVATAAAECIAKVAAGGAFILSAGGGLSPGTTAEHIDALVRAAAEARD